jgi:DNA-binding transcriptional MocR family regulator
LRRLAIERGVQFLPGSAFFFRSPLHNSLRLSFAAEPEERIEEGIAILGGLVGSQRSRLFFTAHAGRGNSHPIL